MAAHEEFVKSVEDLAKRAKEAEEACTQLERRLEQVLETLRRSGRTPQDMLLGRQNRLAGEVAVLQRRQRRVETLTEIFRIQQGKGRK